MSNSLNNLQPMGVAQASAKLQIHPFELVRALVNLKRLPIDLRFSETQLDPLREAIRLQVWFPAGRINGPTPQGLLMDIAHQLVSRGIVGQSGTRLDNCTRGLSEEEGELALRLLRELVSQGVLRSWNSELGVQVAIREGKEYVAADLAEGGEPPGPVNALLQAAVG